MDRAVDQVFSGRVLDADVNSDFGKAAEQFRNEYLPSAKSSHDARDPGRRAQQRQGAQRGGAGGDHTPRQADDLDHPRTKVGLDSWAPATCQPTNPSATAWRSSVAWTNWPASPKSSKEPVLSLGEKRDVPFTATEPYRFCPADGTDLEANGAESRGAACPTCGRSWYRSSAPAVGAAIVDGRRGSSRCVASSPRKGRIDVPGGFVEVGEHPRDAIAREAKEELGVEVEVEETPVCCPRTPTGRMRSWSCHRFSRANRLRRAEPRRRRGTDTLGLSRRGGRPGFHLGA